MADRKSVRIRKNNVRRLNSRSVQIGERYGRLVVIGEPEWHAHYLKRRVIVQCDCGNQNEVYAFTLKTGGSKSCGCLVSETGRARGLELIGETFSFLTVTANEYSDGIRWLHCDCVCGNKVRVRSSGVLSGSTKSCGCFRTASKGYPTTVITYTEAKAKGLRHYFTGKPCKHGHMSARHTINSICIECNRISAFKRLQHKRASCPDP